VGQDRHDEAESGRGGAFGCGNDFVQGAAGEAAFRQVGIKRGKTERQGFALTLNPRQQPAQFVEHDGTVTRQGKVRSLKHLDGSWRCINVSMFSVCSSCVP
jgi:hypothetical protein